LLDNSYKAIYLSMDINIFALDDYRTILIEEYGNRSSRRKNYSMRAFSRDIGLQPTTFNDIINRRYGMSAKTAKKICLHLNFNIEATEYFICLVEKEHARSDAAKKAAELRLIKFNKHPLYSCLSVEDFEILTKWYYLAICGLISVHKNLNERMISKLLKISMAEAKFALKKLEEHGQIKNESGKWIRVLNYSSTGKVTQNSTIRSFHAQMITKALESVDTQPSHQRALYSAIFSLNSKYLQKAIESLNHVHDNFLARYEDGREADSLYALNFQLFRLDQEGE